MQLTTTFLSAVPPLLLSINSALVLGVGGVRVIDGQLSIGMLIAFQALMLAFLNPVNRMVDLASSLSEVRGDMARLDDVLRATRDPYAEELRSDERAECLTEGREAPVKLSGRLELRGLTFGYSRLDPPLIDDFSLTLRPGSRVALVGGSGCGKSTVAKLVAGLYEPWSGEILFDGRPRAAYPRATVANSLAVVDQDVAMFEGTIRDNVTLWDDTVPEADLLQAARDACIHDDIAARPGGYAGPMEEGGAQLQRRAAPAPRDRARARRQPDRARARRGDERARPGDREDHRRQPAPARLHLRHRRAPPEHHPRLRRDPRARSRQDRAARHARVAHGRARPLSQPHRRRVRAP